MYVLISRLVDGDGLVRITIGGLSNWLRISLSSKSSVRSMTSAMDMFLCLVLSCPLSALSEDESVSWLLVGVGGPDDVGWL